MKCIHVAALLLFMLTSALNARAGDPVWMTNMQAPAKKTSLLFKHPYKPAADLCKEYKRKQIAGMVLIPVGAGALAGGTYMIYKGAYNTLYQYNHGIYDYHNMATSRRDVAFVCGGSALFIAGAALLPGGFIMASIAKVKYCKYCRAGGAMYITPSTTGLGLACNF